MLGTRLLGTAVLCLAVYAAAIRLRLPDRRAQIYVDEAREDDD